MRDARGAANARALALCTRQHARSESARCRPARLHRASCADRTSRIRTLLVEQSLAAVSRSNSDHGKQRTHLRAHGVSSVSHRIAMRWSGVVPRRVRICDSSPGLRQLDAMLSGPTDNNAASHVSIFGRAQARRAACRTPTTEMAISATVETRHTVIGRACGNRTRARCGNRTRKSSTQ